MSFADDLGALRVGEMKFDTFARRHSDRFRRWAGYFFERWPQSSLDLSDLTQEAVIEAWRAVDAWDPGRGVSIERFVEYRVGSRLRTELQRVLGWPKKSRGTKAVRPLPIDEVSEIEVEADAERRGMIRDAARRVKDSLAREVVIGVGLGLSTHAVGAELYADPERRERYRFGSESEAIRRVRRAAKLAVVGA